MREEYILSTLVDIFKLGILKDSSRYKGSMSVKKKYEWKLERIYRTLLEAGKRSEKCVFVCEGCRFVDKETKIALGFPHVLRHTFY